jgi:hypothetical protein
MGQPIPRAGAALNGAGTLARMEVQCSVQTTLFG